MDLEVSPFPHLGEGRDEGDCYIIFPARGTFAHPQFPPIHFLRTIREFTCKQWEVFDDIQVTREILVCSAAPGNQFFIAAGLLRRVGARFLLLVPQRRFRRQPELLGVYRLADRLLAGLCPTRAFRGDHVAPVAGRYPAAANSGRVLLDLDPAGGFRLRPPAGALPEGFPSPDFVRAVVPALALFLLPARPQRHRPQGSPRIPHAVAAPAGDREILPIGNGKLAR